MLAANDIMVYVKDLIAPAMTGILGYFGAIHISRSNETIARAKRLDEDKVRRASAREAYTDDLTARFRVLMDGYEGRIADLMTEILALRREVTELREEINDRAKRCHGCPYLHNPDQHDGTD